MEVLPRVIPTLPDVTLRSSALTSADSRSIEPIAANAVAKETPKQSASVIRVQTASPVTELKLYQPLSLTERLRVSNPSDDPATSAIDDTLFHALKKFDDTTQWGRPLDAIERILENGQEKYSQTAERSIAPAGSELGALNLNGRTTDNGVQHADFRLSITTKSGKEINFSFALKTGIATSESGQPYSFQEISVDFQSSDALSDEEKDALIKLSKELNNFAGDFFSNPEDKPQLGALSLFKDDLFSNIQVKLDGSDATLRLNVEETEDKREINLVWRTNLSEWNSGFKVGRSRNELQLIIDKAGTQQGQSIEQNQALDRQQAIIDEQLGDAKANSQQKSFIHDAFQSIHNGLSYSPTLDIVGANDNLVTGLADYNLKFEGETELPMQSSAILDHPVDKTAANLRSNENSRLYKGIQLFELKQKTEIEQQGEKTSIQQEQSMKLEAAYFTALPHLKSADFQHQNFMHHEIDNEHSIISEQTLSDSETISSSITQQLNYQHSVTEYSEGEIVDRQNHDRRYSNIIELGRSSQGLDEFQSNELKKSLITELFAQSAF